MEPEPHYFFTQRGVILLGFPRIPDDEQADQRFAIHDRERREAIDSER